MYILVSQSSPHLTYVGYTVDPVRRWRQHNGFIKGGATKTSRHRPWRMHCFVTGFPTERDALHFEWRLWHPTGSPRDRVGLRMNLARRLELLKTVLGLERSTKSARPTRSMRLRVRAVHAGGERF